VEGLFRRWVLCVFGVYALLLLCGVWWVGSSVVCVLFGLSLVLFVMVGRVVWLGICVVGFRVVWVLGDAFLLCWHFGVVLYADV